MSEDITPILMKVKKLLALSTSSNPNEAAVAAAKAQALLMQYNLTLHEVELAGSSTPAYGKASVDTGSRVWRRQLLTAVAKSNFCESVYFSNRKQSVVIGQAHNQEVVIALYHSLVAQLEPMAVAAYRDNGSYQNAQSWMDSFYMGAVETIWRRLEAQKRAMATDSQACRALVVVKDQELQEALHRFYPRLRPGTRKQVQGTDGYFSGREAGKRVTLNKALSTSV
jgi:Protein of unknown function (DUF2786)